MFHKGLFILAHQIGDISFYQTYKNVIRNQWKPYDEQKKSQEGQLKRLIGFAYENVPYYHKLFKELNLFPGDVRTIEDLEKLPILTKEIIKKNWEELKPSSLSTMRYYDRTTGGTTGTPMQYRVSKYDRFLDGALMYRGWGYGGYTLGDKMVFLAGSSLDVGMKASTAKRAHEVARNIRKLSSFDMGEPEMQKYLKIITKFHPQFIRGYPSSIYLFARWLDDVPVTIPSPKAVFTTAEKLLPHMRRIIENVFDCQVYDNYGLNDGGIGAYECSEHAGLHIDTERSVMEVVDEGNHQIDHGEGRLLATSLHNCAMPFIRYSCGDEGFIVEDKCGCGRGSRLLKEVIGRTTDVLVTPEGKYVHGWFFLYIFWEYGKGIKEYQVIQKTMNKVVIKLVPEVGFDERQLNVIREIVREKSPNWDIEFKYVDTIDKTQAGKYKFISNEVIK